MKNQEKDKNKSRKKRGILKKVLIVLGVLLVVLVLGAAYWVNDGYDPMEEAIASLESSEEVRVVDNEGFIHFQPLNEELREKRENTALIYYPGARVVHRSYAPLMHALAQEGIEGFLVNMPLDLAFFGSNRGGEIIEGHEEIENWIIGGHSLGGAMAARFAYNHEALLEGLVLFASYPASSNDLSDFQQLSVMSIYGDLDGFVTEEDIENSKNYVPGNTRWLEIEGGNHSQFGYYGFQRGDIEALISREEQHLIMIEGFLLWLQEIR